MLADVRALQRLGVDGVVVGCLTAEGEIDEPRMRALVEAARPLSVTCHRAFDMTRDSAAAVEALVRSGVERVLTSGQRDTALEGIETIRATVRGGARPARRHRLRRARCRKHLAGKRRDRRARAALRGACARQPSRMRYRNPAVGMGGTAIEREYTNTLTDEAAVRATIAAARG